MTGNTFSLIIVGSGPVGISIAHRLRNSGHKIAVIEAGGKRQNSRLEQDTLRATEKMPPEHADAHLYRRRMLGGASTVWGGRCLPFERCDFVENEKRPGWPITYDEVKFYLPDALAFLEAGEAVFDEDAFLIPQFHQDPSSSIDLNQIERFSCPTNVWKRYREDLKRASNITILSETLVREVLVSSNGCQAIGLSVIDTATGIKQDITAGQIILACGGIEVPRLLLSSRSVFPNGVGNQNDLVGRFYMTHLLGDVGELTYTPDMSFDRLDYRITRDGVYGRTIMRLNEELRTLYGLPSVLWRPNIPPVWDPSHGNAILSGVHLAKSTLPREYAQRLNAQGKAGENFAPPPMIAHLLNIATHPLQIALFGQNWVRKRILAQRKLPSVFLRSKNHCYSMELNAEQFPIAKSSISLASEKDKFDMPVIKLNWDPGEKTKTGVLSSLELLRERIAMAGLGQFSFRPEHIEERLVPQGGHHIGTTRMGTNPDNGVVDSFGTVFGFENLHIAGASIFPTSSSVNPTLTAVALALRLADRVKQRMDS